jgi:hypothetical protein
MARRARGVLADVQMNTHAEIPKVTHVREMLFIKLHPSRRSSPPSPSVRLRWAPCAWHLYISRWRGSRRRRRVVRARVRNAMRHGVGVKRVRACARAVFATPVVTTTP